MKKPKDMWAVAGAQEWTDQDWADFYHAVDKIGNRHLLTVTTIPAQTTSNSSQGPAHNSEAMTTSDLLNALDAALLKREKYWSQKEDSIATAIMVALSEIRSAIEEVIEEDKGGEDFGAATWPGKGKK